MMSKIFGSVCKHMDGIAFLVACLFIGLLFSSNTDLKNELQSTIKAQNVQIDELTRELKARNESLVKREKKLQKLDESIQLLEKTIASQNEAIGLLTVDLKKRK